MAVGASDALPPVKAVSSRVYAELGAQMAVYHHETGTRIEEPFEYRDGPLARPSDFSVTRFPLPGNPQGVFWWNMVGTPRAVEFDPVALLDRQLAEWRGARAPFITALIHENDFYREGGPGWNSIYVEGDGPRSRPRRAPFDLDTSPLGRMRSAETREAIFRKYEELVARAAAQLRVVTAADIVALAREPANAARASPESTDRAAAWPRDRSGRDAPASLRSATAADAATRDTARELTVDAAQVTGRLRSLLGVNRGPFSWPREPGGTKTSHVENYRRFGIDFIRTHDFYEPTDWHEIFPRWEADPADPASYNFRTSDERIRAIVENGFACFFRLGTSWKGRRPGPINDPPGTRRDAA